jgi:hypothetical protein
MVAARARLEVTGPIRKFAQGTTGQKRGRRVRVTRNEEQPSSKNAFVKPLDAMASPAAPVATLFGSTGGVSASGRPATKTAGQRRNVVDDDVAAVRLVSLVQIRRDRSDLSLKRTRRRSARTDHPNFRRPPNPRRARAGAPPTLFRTVH